MMDARPLARSLARLFFWAVLPVWWFPLTWWLAYLPQPVLGIVGYLALMLDLILVLVLLLAFLVVFVSLPGLLFRRTRRMALLYGASFLVFIPSFTVGECYLGKAVRRDGVSRFERRSTPLVRAIEAYQTERGRPPSTLEELVPAYLGKVPSTGFGASPEYRYLEGKEAKEYGENPWVLIATPPCQFMGFDLLLYFPRRNYPLTGYGGWLERFNSWAYVHE